MRFHFLGKLSILLVNIKNICLSIFCMKKMKNNSHLIFHDFLITANRWWLMWCGNVAAPEALHCFYAENFFSFEFVLWKIRINSIQKFFEQNTGIRTQSAWIMSFIFNLILKSVLRCLIELGVWMVNFSFMVLIFALKIFPSLHAVNMNTNDHMTYKTYTLALHACQRSWMRWLVQWPQCKRVNGFSKINLNWKKNHLH